MMNKHIKIFVQYAMILFVSIIAGFLLLIMVFMIPTDSIYKSVRNALDSFNVEGTYYYLMPYSKGSQLDNFTDAEYLRLSLVGNDEDGIIKNSLGGYVYVSGLVESSNPNAQLREYYNENLSGSYIKESRHIRFWNGYLIVLKPLCIFMGYSNIRQLNMMLELSIVVFTCLLMAKEDLNIYIFPFLLAYYAMNPISLALNIFYSGFFYCAFIPCIIILSMRNIKIKQLIYLFEIIGILVAYFNMNSFQLISWGLPYIFCLLVNKEWHSNTPRFIKESAICFVSWLFGYGFMMFSKWILAALLTDFDIVNTVGKSITTRFSNRLNDNGILNTIPRLEAIDVNFKALMSNKIWVCVQVAFIVICIFLICFLIIKNAKVPKGKSTLTKMNDIAPWLIMIFITITIPCLRYVILANHSLIHYSFVYRDLCISVLAINIVITYFLRLLKMKTPERKYDLYERIDNINAMPK